LLKRIDQAWLTGRVNDLGRFFHDSMTMVFPGFAGRIAGRETMIAGFKEFCESAKVHEYNPSDLQVDVIDNTAVASFKFEMVYEQQGASYRSTGRDFWVFSRGVDGWHAVWRTMIDLNEEPVSG
jgi:hypothetical protein